MLLTLAALMLAGLWLSWVRALWLERNYYRLRCALLERWDSSHDDRVRAALQHQPQPGPIRALARRGGLRVVDAEADRLIARMETP